jgi:hypothetical protein
VDTPGQVQWEALKRVMRYVKKTIDHGLVFKKTDSLKLLGYSDADWASTEDRKSASGYRERQNKPEKAPEIIPQHIYPSRVVVRSKYVMTTMNKAMHSRAGAVVLYSVLL